MGFGRTRGRYGVVWEATSRRVNNYVIGNQSLHAAHVILRFPAPVRGAQMDHRSFNPILTSEGEAGVRSLLRESREEKAGTQLGSLELGTRRIARLIVMTIISAAISTLVITVGGR